MRTLLLCLGLIFASTVAAWATPHQVLMLLWRGETEAEQSFRKELANSGVDIEITIFDAEQDSGNLADFEELSDFAAIYTFGTTAAK